MSDVSRRQFLKTSAMASAAAAAAGSVGIPAKILAQEQGTDGQGVTWSKAPCRFCGTGCHVMVGVRDGRIVGIRGDERAAVNKGLLCVKGYHVGLIPYGPDRLTRPLLRQNGELRPISWDRALTIVAERIKADPKGFAF